jgi:hypothetical protein
MPLTQVPNAMLSTDLQGVTPGFKNRIINGEMKISQRKGASSDLIANIVQYTIDRWCAVSSPQNKITVQQNAGSVTPPSGYTNYLGVTVTTAYTLASTGDFFNIVQFIEGYNAADLAWGTASAKTVAVSFWVRGSVTGTYSFALRNDASNRSYVSTYVINASNTWEYKTIIIPGCTDGTWLTDNGRGVEVNFDLGRSASYETSTANTWLTGSGSVRLAGTVKLIENASATLYITGVQFEKSTVATAFDYRSIGTELELCRRYYQFSSGQLAMPYVSTYYTARRRYSGVFSPPMRSSPTMTATFAYDGTGSGASIGANNATSYISITDVSGGGAAALIDSYTANAEL